MASSPKATIKPINILTSFLLLHLLLLAFLATCAAAGSRTSSDVIKERHPRNLLKPRDLKYGQGFPRITLRDVPDAGKWALGKFPGNWENSVATETPLGWEYIGCDNKLNKTSPTYEDALNVATRLANRGDELCVLDDRVDGPRCTLLATSLSAATYFCGDSGMNISCKEIARIAYALSGRCTERADEEFRIKGTVALFPGGWPLDYTKLSFIITDEPGLYKDI